MTRINLMLTAFVMRKYGFLECLAAIYAVQAVVIIGAVIALLRMVPHQ